MAWETRNMPKMLDTLQLSRFGRPIIEARSGTSWMYSASSSSEYQHRDEKTQVLKEHTKDITAWIYDMEGHAQKCF